MAKLVRYRETGDPTRARVVGYHGKPEELSEKQKEDGMVLGIDKVPAKDQSKLDVGKKAVPYINLKTEEIFFEYVDRKDEQTKIDKIKADVEEIKSIVKGMRGGK